MSKMKCSKCGEDFSSERGLKTHNGIVHVDKPSEEEIRNLYYGKEMTTSEVKEELGIGSKMTLLKYMDEYNIERRSRSEATKIEWKGADKRKEKLAEFVRNNSFDVTPWPENCTDEEYEEKCKEIQEAILEVSDGWSGEDNPAKREEVREKISESHENNPRTTNFEFVEELGHNVRSGWEKDVGLLMKRNNIDYSYEDEVFVLERGCRYIPDFFLDDYIVEVKGRVRGNTKKKARLLMEQEKREYIVVGTKIPCDIHIPYSDRERLIEVVEE